MSLDRLNSYNWYSGTGPLLLRVSDNAFTLPFLLGLSVTGNPGFGLIWDHKRYYIHQHD